MIALATQYTDNNNRNNNYYDGAYNWYHEIHIRQNDAYGFLSS